MGSPEKEVLIRLFDQAAASFSAHPHQQWFIGFLDGKAVSTGCLIETDSSYGIYDVMTRQECRGRGLGSTKFGYLLQRVKEGAKGNLASYKLLQMESTFIGKQDFMK
ncbi:GNAT family N-acetyltransferase [Brevibacillus sp. SIMBA_040]|uniref:GNAT family N-acetyltransferase n=1 Tax=unclassified Brevibacillus TaxID=2684853 RepID=UPI00397E535F